MGDQITNQKPKSKRSLWIALGSFLFIGCCVFIYWLMVLRFEEYTNDAYVSGNMIEITPQVPGIVSDIFVEDTYYVEKGQVLVEMDKTDNEIAYHRAQNVLAERVRNVSELFFSVDVLSAEYLAQEAFLFKADVDYKNRVNLVEVGGVSAEDFEHVEADLMAARASLEAVKKRKESAEAQVAGTTIASHPLVQEAANYVRESFVNLQRCTVKAPNNGYIAMRSVQLGESVDPSRPLMALIPLNELWITANYKETQLSKVRVGQPVKVTSDLYGDDVVFKGNIVGINPGSGNVFSILPPQNATGNWIKIIQRIPVRISLDLNQLKTHPLWLGLSMNTTIDIHNTTGNMLRVNTSDKKGPIYQTSIYSSQEEGVDAIIHHLILNNMCGYGP